MAYKKCYSCNGKGYKKCPVCHGRKRVNGKSCDNCYSFGTMILVGFDAHSTGKVECDKCDGKGRLD